jgi:hypothetical protein
MILGEYIANISDEGMEIFDNRVFLCRQLTVTYSLYSERVNA